MSVMSRLITELNTNPMSALLETKLDKGIRDMIDKRQENRDDTTFHVSSVIINPKDFCARKCVYLASKKIFVPQRKLASQTCRIFMNGNVHHEKWQNLFRSMGIANGIEQCHYSQWMHLTGTPDAIVEVWDRQYIVEIKSMRAEVFRCTKTVPKAACIQAHFYMYMTGIPRAIVLVDNKNDHSIKLFFIDFDMEIIRPYIEQHAEVLWYLNNHKLPKRVCSSCSDRLAKKCICKEICLGAA